jgi:hypothetical protein
MKEILILTAAVEIIILMIVWFREPNDDESADDLNSHHTLI